MLVSALVLGLMGSLHCVGMCGPIAFMLPLSRTNQVTRWGQLSLYHVGRILSYGIIGLLFGLLGRGLMLFGIQQKLSLIIGAIMILAVIIPSRYYNQVRITRPLYQLVGKLKSMLGTYLKKRSSDAFLTIGFLNGFLPCGLVYMAVFGAIAMGSSGEGSLYMMLFGIGTVPLMSATALLGGSLKKSLLPKVRKWIPAFVVLIGLLFILRGLGLGIPYLSPAEQSPMISNTIECIP